MPVMKVNVWASFYVPDTRPDVMAPTTHGYGMLTARATGAAGIRIQIACPAYCGEATQSNYRSGWAGVRLHAFQLREICSNFPAS
jgi:hypothetical protein